VEEALRKEKEKEVKKSEIPKGKAT